MTVRERLNEDLKTAMRERAALRLSTIRMMRAEILNKDKEHGTEATEEEILRVLQSMLKKREEAAEQFAKAGRQELALQEREEMQVIRQYLPAQIEDEELRRAAQAAIAETGAASMKDMGKVMGLLTRRLGGQATPARISQVVKELLSKS